MLRLASLISLLLFTLYSCKVDTHFPKTPNLFDGSYSLLKGKLGNDSLVIRFSFTDGDGNVGLNEWDTLPPYDYNLFIDYFEKESDGVFRKQLIPGSGGKDTINFNARIKDLTSVSKSPLQGDVERGINIEFALRDTIRLDYYITDHDLNKSNRLSTGVIVLKR